MMVDWGLPRGAQEDLSELASEFIDLAKVAVGISGLISERALMAKIAAYQKAGIEPFPGGQFLELAFRQNQVPEYFDACRRAGYRLVEVSDNIVRLTGEERTRLIRQAIDDYGLRVLGEVGSKLSASNPETLLAEIQDCLAAGAWKVLIEAAEFVSPQGIDTSLMENMLAEVDQSDIMFELPGKWIADVHGYQVYQMMIWLVEQVGPDVNIGNVAPEDVIPLETLRTGVGVTLKI
jgi:phosphosulfolactate synthase